MGANFMFADRMPPSPGTKLSPMGSFPLSPGRRAALLLGLGALTACTPRTAGPGPVVQGSTTAQSVSFYPREAGLSWSYLAEGESAGASPYTLRTLGPTLFGSQTVDATVLSGRGADQTWYRTVGEGGVRLYGIRKPGVTIRLEPPWQEFPAPGSWRLGLTWQGSSQVTILGDDGKVQAQGTLNYSYLVQEQRRVSTPAGGFDVYVVTRQISDTLGGLFPATQQLWFSPYVGEVRTPEGLLLTGRNFSARAGGQP